MKKLIFTLFIITTAFSVTGCSSMNGSFDCPNKAGVNCKSLDQVNDMVDSGQVHGQSNEAAFTGSAATSNEFGAYPASEIYHPGAPLRYGETVQRIWVAPFEDTDGNYHQDSLMYAIVKKGHWIGAPLKSVKSV